MEEGVFKKVKIKGRKVSAFVSLKKLISSKRFRIKIKEKKPTVIISSFFKNNLIRYIL